MHTPETVPAYQAADGSLHLTLAGYHHANTTPSAVTLGEADRAKVFASVANATVGGDPDGVEDAVGNLYAYFYFVRNEQQNQLPLEKATTDIYKDAASAITTGAEPAGLET